MFTAVRRLVRPPLAFLALWVTINMLAASAALAQEPSGRTASAPSVHASAEPFRPIAALADSALLSPCTANNQRPMAHRSSYASSVQDFTPLTRDGCQFIRAELLDTNGPTGGWCWRITTACDQYLQGDCWYTSEVILPSIE
jgi:hypothetical protein